MSTPQMVKGSETWDREAAWNRVKRGQLQLMLQQPFLASAVARLPMSDETDSDWCGTAATDGYHIFVNLRFFDTLEEAEVSFVLAHELLHCVLGHPDRRGTRERLLWNIAIDFATNALLVETGFTPPERALYEKKYAGLTAEAIYDILLRSPELVPPILGTSGSLADADNEGREASGHPGMSAGYDTHLEVGDLELSGARGADMPSPEQRVRLRAGIGLELKAKLAGRAAGYWAAEITVGTELVVPWQQLLARFVSGLRRSDYRLFPPSKKHLWRGIYMPTLGVPGPTHLVVAIDTSGSMSMEQLAAVFGEIDALRAAFECKVTVVQCDAAIQHVVEQDPWDEIVPPTAPSAKRRAYGRGGTDLRVPFKWLEGQMAAGIEQPDALIYCTDGFGPFPASEPEGYPVLWILTANGASSVPFGDVVRLPV